MDSSDDRESLAQAHYELAQRVQAGDRAAFDGLMEELAPVVHRFAMNRLQSDPETARDVVQNTLCKVMENLAKFRGESSLFTWACGICRYEIFGAYRSAGRAAEHSSIDDENARLEDVLSQMKQQDRPDQRFEDRELASWVHLTLDHLPDRYARALELKYAQAQPVREVARVLGVGEKAAESVLTRAREAFRKAFHRVAREGQAGSRPGRRR